MVPFIAFLFIASFLLLNLPPLDAQVGVCYGRRGNNLPGPRQVVELYKQYNIKSMRLYDPDQATLQAVQGTNIKLMLGVSNEDIEPIGCYPSIADTWVRTNVVPYASSIKYIAVGNEIEPSDPQAPHMVQAMQNIVNALNSHNLGNQIIVSTAINMDLVQNTYPPSHAEFKDLSYITPIIKFLLDYDWPLFVNIEPYATYMNDPKNIPLDFALFTSCGYKFIDDKTKLGYQNLFDAQYDAVWFAAWKVGLSIENQQNGRQLRPQISKSRMNGQRQVRQPFTGETGWSKGFSHGMSRSTTHNNNVDGQRNACGYPKHGELGTMENAEIFYKNMINHVKKGTPLSQGYELEVFLFAMFDENLKTGDESEKHYGLFTPDGRSKYGILNFCVDQ
ncbi:glucan endo-1,3-beta-glucosidase-like [Amaranthus tricolor]|uniref:glucan endo-1,3-beta-glucosidase-like n=1 Tax=Amaranthus tricolor TaxID=29722 RepID=UPI002584D4CF|nr:glucan endo-1,3-beta-glucosidase-like [Amaranthus tricolor]